VLSTLYQVFYIELLLKNYEYFLGDGPNCGNAIAVHKQIDKVAFTGSVEVRILKSNYKTDNQCSSVGRKENTSSGN
jgi:hypothetical protein